MTGDSLIRCCWFAGWLLLAGLLARETSPSRAEEPAADAVAATVNGQPILAAEVQAVIARLIEGRKVEGDSRRQLQAEGLDQLIDRYLIEQRLAREKETAQPAEIDAAVANLEAEAALHKTTLEKHLAQRHLSPATLRKQLAFQLAWKKYAQKQLTEESLKAFFQAHGEEYDGTERRVSHIILRPERAGDPAGTAKLITEANAIREQIEQGKISFQDAAAKYSAGPSRQRGGDVGFIPRRGLMDETFSRAAFSLAKGELSRPVVTPFGVHLMRVTDVKKGGKTFEDVRQELLEPATTALYEKVAAAERKKARLAFTGDVPHYKPGTKQLAP